MGRLVLFALAAGAVAWGALRLTSRTLMKTSSRPAPLVRAERPPAPAIDPAVRPRNLIVVLADGMGFGHLAAARAVLHGLEGPASWDRLPTTGWQTTHPADGFLTDSAAAATALATGVPTRLGAVGVDPRERQVETLFERASSHGYRTGVVTDSYVWDATPAAFVTHVADRVDAAEILRQLAASDLDLLFGELEDVGEGEVPERAATVELFARRFEIVGHDLATRANATPRPVAALFDEDEIADLRSTPSLPEMAAAALDRLAAGGEPFLLLVESEEPDSASHRGDLDRLLRGMAAVDRTLSLLLDFAERDGETLVVFTSDHETGGLALSVNDRSNSTLRALWSTIGHTGEPVPLMAYGPGADAFGGVLTNWEVGRRLLAMVADGDAPPHEPSTVTN